MEYCLKFFINQKHRKPPFLILGRRRLFIFNQLSFLTTIS
jgi:hypothetical protein